MIASPILYAVAAQQLAEARRAMAPCGRLEAQCRPGNIEDALEIQRRVRIILNQSVGGWKCSLPGPNVVAAPIYAPDIFTSSPCPVIADGGLARAEPEIAFVLGCDLPARDSGYSEIEISTFVRRAGCNVSICQERIVNVMSAFVRRVGCRHTLLGACVPAICPLRARRDPRSPPEFQASSLWRAVSR